MNVIKHSEKRYKNSNWKQEFITKQDKSKDRKIPILQDGIFDGVIVAFWDFVEIIAIIVILILIFSTI